MNTIEQTYIDSHSKSLTGSGYYMVSVKPYSDKITYASFFSIWNETIDRNREIREISEVEPDKIITGFKNDNQNVSIVDNANDLYNLINLGGHGLIDKAVMKTNWSEVLVPKITVDTHHQGLIAYDSLPSKYTQRVARDGYRAQILDRDSLQCRVCGSSPDDSPHVRLEVHHIKPWEQGGMTEPENLITLCKSCHDGVKYINRHDLYRKIGVRFYHENNLIHDPKSTSHLIRHVMYNSVLFKIDKNKIVKKV